MPAVALTDHSNLYGAYKFVKAIYNHPATKRLLTITKMLISKPFAVKGVVGCEMFVCKEHTDKNNKDNGYRKFF